MRRLFATAVVVACFVVPSFAADPPEDTPKAAAARKVLKTKVTFTWKATSLGDAIDEIKENVKLGIKPDTKGGINLNKPLTYSSSGLGGNGHLMTEFFGQRANVKVEHIPYKGASQGLVDLIGGLADPVGAA